MVYIYIRILYVYVGFVCVCHICMLFSNIFICMEFPVIALRDCSAERSDCHMNPDERSLVGGFNPISKI